jgi:hypothetical protein
MVSSFEPRVPTTKLSKSVFFVHELDLEPYQSKIWEYFCLTLTVWSPAIVN